MLNKPSTYHDTLPKANFVVCEKIVKYCKWWSKKRKNIEQIMLSGCTLVQRVEVMATDIKISLHERNCCGGELRCTRYSITGNFHSNR